MNTSRTWFAVLSLLHLSPVALAAAPALEGKTYGAGDLTLPKLAKTDDATLARQILACTKGYKVDTIVRKGGEVVWSAGDAATQTLDKVTHAERVALLAVLGRQLRGAEVDAFVPVPEGGVPVSVSWDEPGVVTFESGPAKKTLFDETMTAEKLQQKYGVGEFTENGSAWDGVGYSAVDQALATLTPAELAMIKGLPFRRGRLNPKERALYHRGDDDNSITVFDAAISLDRFTGSVNDPRPEAIHPITHEVGHAVADAVFRELGYASKAAADDFRKRQNEPNELAAEFNAKAQALGPNPDKKGQAELDALTARLAKAKQQNDERYALATKLVEAMRARDRKIAAGRPAELAFTRVLEQRRSPTVYGRTRPAEHFAESFGIFHADPAALERISPEAAEWFRKAEHVTIASQPVE